MSDNPVTAYEHATVSCGCLLLRGNSLTTYHPCQAHEALAQMPRTSYLRTIDDAPDSLEIGTPGKEGAIKIYGDASDPVAFQTKITAMLELRARNNKKETA